MERSKGSTWGFLISTPPVFSRRMQERIYQTDQFRLDLPFKPRSTSGWERHAILPAKQKTTPLIAKLGICDKTKKNKIRLAILNYKLAKGFYRAPETCHRCNETLSWAGRDAAKTVTRTNRRIGAGEQLPSPSLLGQLGSPKPSWLPDLMTLPQQNLHVRNRKCKFRRSTLISA